MAFYQLLISNLKMIVRHWRGLFWTLALPIALYMGIAIIGGSFGSEIPIRYSEYLLPGMIAMTIMQTGLFSLSYWLVEMKHIGVIKRFTVTPISNRDLIGSLVVSRLVVMLAQVITLTLVGRFFFGAQINGSLLSVIILMVLGGTIFLTVGFLISAIAKSYDEAAPITTMLNFVLMFLGNVFFPTDSFPRGLAVLSDKIPLTYLAEGLRINFVQAGTLKQTLPDIGGLLIWLVIIAGIAFYTFKLKQE